MPNLCFFSIKPFTGGSYALHQGVERANALGAEAVVMYLKRFKGGFLRVVGDQIRPTAPAIHHLKIDPRLRDLGVPKTRRAWRDTHFIVPECMPEAALELLKMGCPHVYIWWLSVDNFPSSPIQTLEYLSLFRQCSHLCQSEYARAFVEGHGATDVLMLSDVTDLGEIGGIPAMHERKYDIAYLPAKAMGAEAALQELGKSFSIVALEKMSRADVTEALKQSRIFLDFGHHPGKDRVPREAVLCGAVPVVRKQGAAAYPKDVPLPDDLLIQTELFFDEPALAERIGAILRDVEKWQNTLQDYKNTIESEGERFDQEMRILISRVSEKRAVRV